MKVATWRGAFSESGRGLRERIRLLAAVTLCAAIPVVAIGLVSYAAARESLVEEAERYHQTVTRQVQERGDTMLDIVERVVVQHALDERLGITLRGGALDEDEFEQLRIMSVLSAMEALIEHVDKAYLYMPEEDILLTADGLELSPSSWLGPELHAALGKADVSELWMDRLGDDADDRGHRKLTGLSYARGIPVSAPEPIGYYIVQLQEQALFDLYTDNASEGEWGLLAISPEGRMYASPETREFALAHLSFEELKEWSRQKLAGSEGETSSELVGGRRLLVHALRSPVTEWVYLSVVPYDELTARVQAVSRGVLLSTSALAVVAAIAILLLSNNTYRRFRQALEHLQLRNSTLEREATATLPERQRYLIHRWLLEPLGGEDERRLAELGLGGRGGAEERFYLAICAEREGRRPHDDAVHAAKTAELLRWVEERLAEDPVPGYFVQIGTDMVGGAFVLDSSGDAGFVIEWCERLSVSARELGIAILLGVGTVQAERGELYRSFEQARRALQQRLADEARVLFVARSGEEPDSGGYLYPFEQEKSVVAQLKLGETEKAKEALRGFTAALRAGAGTDEGRIIGSYDLLAAAVVRVLFEGNTLTSAALFDYNLHERLQGFRTVTEIEKWLAEEVFERIAAQMRQARQARETVSDSMVTKAMEYVQTHYDQDLSLALLADLIGASEGQLSQAFKREIGLTFTDYLIGIRVDIAKELLRATDMKVTELAERMRYNNSQNFIRVFKRITGVTPGEFRRQNG